MGKGDIVDDNNDILLNQIEMYNNSLSILYKGYINEYRKLDILG